MEPHGKRRFSNRPAGKGVASTDTPLDPITALLRTRPDAMRGVLKAFGWTFHGRLGWCSSIWLGERYRFAILDLQTLAWRVGPEGKRGTLRGWLADSFRWHFRLRGVPREWWPTETGRIIQSITGPWPEMQAECERQRAASHQPEKVEVAAPVQTVQGSPAPLLLDTSNGWPYEPDSAPNVTPFLRKWSGPR